VVQTAKERVRRGTRSISFRTVADLVLAAFATGFRGALGIVGKVAAAVLAAFMARLGGALWVVGEIAAAVLAAFMTGLGSAFAVLGKVAAAAAMLSHGYLLC